MDPLVVWRSLNSGLGLKSATACNCLLVDGVGFPCRLVKRTSTAKMFGRSTCLTNWSRLSLRASACLASCAFAQPGSALGRQSQTSHCQQQNHPALCYWDGVPTNRCRCVWEGRWCARRHRAKSSNGELLGNCRGRLFQRHDYVH